MKIKNAITLLKKAGCRVEEIDGKYLFVYDGTQFHDAWDLKTARQIINLAKIWNKKSWKKDVKELTNRPNRRKIRQQLTAGQDDINPDRRNKKNNPWNYD